MSRKKPIKRRSPLKLNNRERMVLLYALDLAWRSVETKCIATYRDAVITGILKSELSMLGQKFAAAIATDGAIPKRFMGK